MDHPLALVHGEGLSQRFAADGSAGDQRCDTHGDQHAFQVQSLLQPGHDHRAGSAGDDAADIAHHVIADAGHPVRVPQELQCLFRALFLVGGHGVERLGVRRRHRHAHHVEDDAQRDKHRQYQQRYHVTCALQRRGGEKAHNGTERYRQQEYPQRPAVLLFAFLFILTVTVCQVTNLAFLIKFLYG